MTKNRINANKMESKAKYAIPMQTRKMWRFDNERTKKKHTQNQDEWVSKMERERPKKNEMTK